MTRGRLSRPRSRCSSRSRPGAKAVYAGDPLPAARPGANRRYGRGRCRRSGRSDRGSPLAQVMRSPVSVGPCANSSRPCVAQVGSGRQHPRPQLGRHPSRLGVHVRGARARDAGAPRDVLERWAAGHREHGPTGLGAAARRAAAGPRRAAAGLATARARVRTAIRGCARNVTLRAPIWAHPRLWIDSHPRYAGAVDRFTTPLDVRIARPSRSCSPATASSSLRCSRACPRCRRGSG